MLNFYWLPQITFLFIKMCSMSLSHYVIEGLSAFISVFIYCQAILLTLSMLPLEKEAKKFFYSEIYPIALYMYSWKLNWFGLF